MSLISGTLVDLKPFGLEDLEFLYRWNNDPSYSGEFEPFENVTREELDAWLRKKKSTLWFVIQRKDGEKVGQVVARPHRSTYKIGYRIVPDQRGNGYASSAVYAFVKHLFEVYKLDKIEAGTDPSNVKSMRVLERAGFKKVGFREKAVEINGVWHDGVEFQLKRGDWEKNYCSSS